VAASGRTNVRMPRKLHADLQKRSKQQGVSLNTLMVSLLAGGVGFKLKDEGK